MAHTSDDVARYYERNTATFLRFGVGRSARAIHRPLWGPEVENRTEALHFVHDHLLQELNQLGGPETQNVLDLGCGTGSSLLYLLDQGVATGTGVNNSATQLEILRQTEKAQRFGERLQLVEDDFCTLADGTFAHDAFDLVFAIESFTHSTSAQSFFDRATRFLRRGGRLVVCDDFLASPAAQKHQTVQEREEADTRNKNVEILLSRFRRGWHLDSLIAVKDLYRLAKSHRLEPVWEANVSDFLRPGRLRSAAVATAVRIGNLLSTVPALAESSLYSDPRWLNLVGGDALRRLLDLDAVEYRIHVWRKP